MTVFAAGVLLLEGCLKSKSTAFTNQITSTPNTVDFNNQVEAAALDISATPTIYPFYVEANSSNKTYPAGTVTITKTPTVLVDYYNADPVNNTKYSFLPDSAYQLVNNTATIDPVTHLAAFQLKVFTTKINLDSAYAVAYTITSVSNGATIASNKKTTLISVGAKNKYDGVFSLRVKTTGWTAYGIADGVTADYPGEYGMETKGINNVAGNSYARGGDYLLPAFAGTANQPGTLGGPTAFGATTPVFYFDVTTNQLINVINSTPDDGRGRVLLLNPAITTSRFVPATRKIYAAFIMKQNGRPDQFFYDTLTYLHSR